MAQIFPPIANVIAKASILGGLLLLVLAGWVCDLIWRSPYVTGAGVVLNQPVPFSHRNHANELGIDCRYCHTTVEEGAMAGMPTLTTCMTCHSQIHTEPEMLAPVRTGYRDGVPIAWWRVHDLPDFVYFDHSIHVNKGVACETCHGAVQEMPLTWQHTTLHMQWCVDCHRDPAPFIRPREAIFELRWQPGEGTPSGRELIKQYGIESANGRLMNCSICHR